MNARKNAKKKARQKAKQQLAVAIPVSAPSPSPLEVKSKGLIITVTETTNPKEIFLKKTSAHSIDSTCLVTKDGTLISYHYSKNELYLMDSTYTKGHIINTGDDSIYAVTCIGNAIIIQLYDHWLLFDAKSRKLLDLQKTDILLDLRFKSLPINATQFLCRDGLSNSILHYDISKNKLDLIGQISLPPEQQITAIAINSLGQLQVSVVDEKIGLPAIKIWQYDKSNQWICADKPLAARLTLPSVHTMINADNQLIVICYKDGTHLQNTVKGTTASFSDTAPKSEFHLLGSYLLAMGLSEHAGKYTHCLYLIDINTMKYYQVDFPDKAIINLSITTERKLFFLTKDRLYDMDKKDDLSPELAALVPIYQMIKARQPLSGFMFTSTPADKPKSEEKKEVSVSLATLHTQSVKPYFTHWANPAALFYTPSELKAKMMTLLSDKIAQKNPDALDPRVNKELEAYLKNHVNFYVGKTDTVRHLIEDIGKQAQELLSIEKKSMALIGGIKSKT